MKTSKLLTMILLAASITACGGGSNNGENNTPKNSISNRTWKLCNSFSNTSSEFTYIFTETDYFYTTATFLNNNCSGTPDTMSELNSGTYSVQNTITTINGFDAIEIDFNIDNAFGGSLGSSAYTMFDIFYIDNDVLYFSSQQEFDAEDRQQEIDLDFPYILER